MSVAGNIKQFLPGSSRSLHAMHRDVADMHDEMHVEIAEIKRQLGELYRRVEQADNGINMNLNYKYGLLDSSLDAHDAHMKMFAWENYRRGGETLEDAKKRFFRSLPKATGGMRLLQLGCAKLLGEFDALCKANEIPYWINFGTLIGAIRHGGFIPWDDDTDLGIMRDDLDRLMNVVEEESRYRITVVYDKYVHCRQVRFLYADGSIPCFLDLFIHDWAPAVDAAKAERQRELRRQMVDEMEKDERLAFWGECPYYSGEKSALIQGYYDRCLGVSRDEGIICDGGEAKAIVWAIDNLDDDKQHQWSYSLSDLFPTQEIEFEGVKLEAPGNPDVFLQSRYGDILELPKDIHTHFEHVDHDELESGDTNEAMRELLGE